MTGEETARILTLIQAEYPHSFAKLDERQMALKVQLWEKEFADDDVQKVYTAVRMLFESGIQYAPNIGDIRGKMRMLQKTETLTEQEAWALVSRAAKNSAYNSVKEFEKLPPEVKRAVGSPEQLKAWAMMPAETVESVVASNFMRSYKVVSEREKKLSLYPASLRNAISNYQIGEWKSLPGKENEYVNSSKPQEAQP